MRILSKDEVIVYMGEAELASRIDVDCDMTTEDNIYVHQHYIMKMLLLFK